MEADLTGSSDTSLTKGIEGKVTLGQNGVTLSLKEKTITFLSDAAAKAGETGGATFTVIANDASQLVASFFDGQSMNNLVLSKSTGLAIWSKIRSTFPVYNAPTGGLSYLVCR